MSAGSVIILRILQQHRSGGSLWSPSAASCWNGSPPGGLGYTQVPAGDGIILIFCLAQDPLGAVSCRLLEEHQQESWIRALEMRVDSSFCSTHLTCQRVRALISIYCDDGILTKSRSLLFPEVKSSRSTILSCWLEHTPEITATARSDVHYLLCSIILYWPPVEMIRTCLRDRMLEALWCILLSNVES